MHRDRMAALYDVHSWAGVVFAALVFIVCASGAVAVFSSELDHWANPALRTRLDAPVAIDLDRALATFERAQPLEPLVIIGLPQPLQNHYSLFAGRKDEPQARLYVSAETGALHTARQSYVFWYLRHLHVRLMSPWHGRLFVGLIGVAMLLSVVTGILIHKHLVRDLFRLRVNKSGGDRDRTVVSELHKWIGVWALMFQLMISLTGTWLGLESYISAAVRAGLPPSQSPRAKEPPSTSNAPVAMISIAPLLERARHDLQGLVPTNIALQRWGTDQASVTIAGDIPGALIQRASARVIYKGVDGALSGVTDPRLQGVWAQVHAALEPLHYGYYGGTTLKFLYLLLGLSPAVVSLTGALIWFDRRARLRGAAPVKERVVSSPLELS